MFSYLSRSRKLTTLYNVARVYSSASSPVKSFDEIPKPKGLPLLGTSLEIMKHQKKLHELISARFKKYGPIYKERLLPSEKTPSVFICDPKDTATVLRADGKYPNRPDIGLLLTELRDQLNLNDPQSLFIAQGENWYRQRQPMSQFMMVPRKVGEYYKQFNEITTELLDHIEKIKDPQTNIVSNLLPVMKLWSFESAVVFTLGKRLHILNDEVEFPEGKEFVKLSDEMNEAFVKSAFYPQWFLKRFKPKSWKMVLEKQQKTFEIAKGWIEDKENEIKSLVENNEMPELPDFLTHMLVSGKLTLKEITMNALDLLTAGIETTSTTLSWALYELAINPDSQDKLRSEVKRVVSNDELITPEHIHNMPYLRWCIKETLRVHSIAFANLRETTEDVVLSGYHIPAGNTVFVVMSEMVKSAENYSEPDKFMPERWDREGGSNIDSFTNIQFGFGPRMCVGRRVAELELHIALADIIRKYSSIEFPDDKPMEEIVGAVLTMERDLNLKLVK